MAFEEIELDQIIKNQLSIELASSIEVPDINVQWEKIKAGIIAQDTIQSSRKTFLTRKRLAIAVTILISIASLNYLALNNAEAKGGKAAGFIDTIVEKATQKIHGSGSKTESKNTANPGTGIGSGSGSDTDTQTQTDTNKQLNNAVLPNLQNSGSIIDSKITINKLVPSYSVPQLNTKPVVPAPIGTPINLGSANNYTILAKSGISSVPNSFITGNIGVSPIASTAMTGFSLTLNAAQQFSASTQVIGNVYAPDYASPTSGNLTTAVNNMETAYTEAANRPVNYAELNAGNISGQTLTPGVYKWATGVLINSDVTLHGGPNDVFIFQIAKGITQASGTKIILTGGAQAKNIFWQSSETVAIGTDAHFEGIILGKTNITLGAHASIKGRLLAQTAVTLIMNTVSAP